MHVLSQESEQDPFGDKLLFGNSGGTMEVDEELDLGAEAESAC